MLLASDPSIPDLLAYYAKINKILTAVPYGVTRFEQLNFNAKQFGFTHQIGTDKRIAAASGFPRPGIRQLIQQTQLDNAILRNSNRTSPLAAASITQGTRAFPQVTSTKIFSRWWIDWKNSLSVWCFIFTAHICSYARQGKGRSNFGYDDHEWTFYHEVLYITVHHILPTFRSFDCNIHNHWIRNEYSTFYSNIYGCFDTPIFCLGTSPKCIGFSLGKSF